MSKSFAAAVLTALLLVSVGSPAMAEVYVFGNPARFDRFAQAPAVPIPHSALAFPGTTCGGGDRGPTGSGPSVNLPIGTNCVTITGGNGYNLCIFDGGTMIFSVRGELTNTQPNFMTANTIVQDTLKDLRLVFDRPVQAVAFTFLTNNAAHEVATFKDVGGNIIDTVNVDRFTPRNVRAFVDFISRMPIKEIYLAIDVGTPGQNEGIQAIKVSETVSIPGRLASDSPE
jgi:hypothetical protein